MIEVKTIGSEDRFDFEKRVKDFYNDETIEVIDVKYSAMLINDYAQRIILTAMIIFKRKEQTND